MQEDSLVEVIRAGQIESRHHVSFAVADAEGRLHASWGDPELVTFLRSSAKPFQAIPFVESGALDHFHLDLRDLALVCSSHAGTQMHVDLARRILGMIEVSEEALLCGTHIPYDDGAYEQLLRSGGALEPVRNNCSGKHAGMLALAKFLGADLHTYLQPNHPIQERILETVSEMSATPKEDIIVGVDGCSAPTFALPLRSTARAYANFVESMGEKDKRQAACRKIFEAMTGHPELVAGPGRFDTVFMRAVHSRILSKAGAEGFQAVGIPRGVLREGSPSLGIAVKVHDGDCKDHHAAALTVVELIDQLGGFHADERTRLSGFDARNQVNLSGIVVGEVRINPSFKREFNIDHEWL